MKLAVSSRGQSLQDNMDLGFGRCPGFVIYDTETQAAYYIDNSRNKDLSQGAGPSAVQLISSEGVQAVISGQIGPNALQALNKAQIEAFASSASLVQEAIQAWERDELQHVSSATSPGGAGQGKGKGGAGMGRGPDRGGQGRGGGARGRGSEQGGQGQGGGARGRGPDQGGQGQGGGARGKGPGQGGRGKGGGAE